MPCLGGQVTHAGLAGTEEAIHNEHQPKQSHTLSRVQLLRSLARSTTTYYMLRRPLTIRTTGLSGLGLYSSSNRRPSALSTRLQQKSNTRTSGINPDRVVFITWLIVGTLACVAGTLYGLDKSYKPIIYLNLVLPIFASAIVGGIGSPFGAVVGGYVIAFSEIMVTYAYKKFFKYLLPENLEPSSLVQLLSTDYKFAVSFTILVIVLLIRPSGIFKGKVL